jgi:hypothetical protein
MVRRRQCPRQRAAARTVLADGISTVVGPEGQRYALNETALALWELCDGLTTSDEMVSAICLLFDAEQSLIAADVRRALWEFESRHLLDWVDDATVTAPATLPRSGPIFEERK